MNKDEYSPRNKDTGQNTITPKSTERAKAIFKEACTVENMDAKFGKTLSKIERDVKDHILSQSPILVRITTIDEIISAFAQIPPQKLNMILTELDRVDVIHLDETKTRIMAAYPFSGSETPHIVTLKKDGFKKMFAMCAVDALGVCFMYDCDVAIDSTCAHCGDTIQIEIGDNRITFLRPKTTVVWCDLEYSCCAATSLCRNIHFFSSKEHFNEFQSNKPKRRVHLLDIDEAFYVGKLFFNNRI